MRFDRNQFDLISKYFSDLSKILVASVVIGFFIPAGAKEVSLNVFLWGIVLAVGCFIFSVNLAKERQ